MAVTGAMLALASSAFASGPTTLGVSGWQVYSNTTIYSNPDPAQIHGEPGEYAAAPAIPGENDSGWVNCGPSAPQRYGVDMCPSPTFIGMAVHSILPGCWSGLNFTYFQALVSIPANTDVTSFSVNMSGADDGARISLVNSQYPSGITPDPGGYIYQGTPQATGNLASYVVAGEVNRVIITQVDDCAVGNNLNSAQIYLNGGLIPVKPTDSPVVTPAPNANGWNDSDGTVAWNWADDGLGLDPANCTQTSSFSGEGTHTLTSSCSDLQGNSASDSLTLNVDETAPAAAPVAEAEPNANGWYAGDATVDWNWSDSGGSGIDTSNCTNSTTSSGEGTLTLSATCADLAGNLGTATDTVNVDKTPPADSPVVSPAPNGAGWNNSDVTVDWNWTDGGSGIDTSNCTQTSASSGEGAITLTSTCEDLAGNSASDSVTVNVDQTAPTLSPSVSPAVV
ncbi:MAG: hypothetical protein ACRDLR_02315, partial [Gaiellaceae bacterium]